MTTYTETHMPFTDNPLDGKVEQLLVILATLQLSLFTKIGDFKWAVHYKGKEIIIDGSMWLTINGNKHILSCQNECRRSAILRKLGINEKETAKPKNPIERALNEIL